MFRVNQINVEGWVQLQIAFVSFMTSFPCLFVGAGTGIEGAVVSVLTGNVAPAVVTGGGHAALNANPTATAAAAGTETGRETGIRRETGTRNGHQRTKVKTHLPTSKMALSQHFVRFDRTTRFLVFSGQKCCNGQPCNCIDGYFHFGFKARSIYFLHLFRLISVKYTLLHLFFWGNWRM